MANKVELLGYYGSDITHAQSAWTSTSRDITDEKKARIPKLLNMLASEGHETPFEKSSFHFLVTVEQATHIHLLKHRMLDGFSNVLDWLQSTFSHVAKF